MCEVGGERTDVRGLVTHAFISEYRWGQVLIGEKPTPADSFKPQNIDEIWAIYATARKRMEAWVAAATPEELAQILTVKTSKGDLPASKRKVLTHSMIHGIRHWAQIAMALRQACFVSGWSHDFDVLAGAAINKSWAEANALGFSGGLIAFRSVMPDVAPWRSPRLACWGCSVLFCGCSAPYSVMKVVIKTPALHPKKPTAGFSGSPAPGAARQKLVNRFVFAGMVIAAAAIGVFCGLLLVYSTDLPQVTELERYRPSSVTQLYDIHGKVIGSFALQRRIIAAYEDYPDVLRGAVISIEDKGFETHWGIDFWRILGAAYRDVVSGSRAQGGSTLTMQLARNLFLSPDRKFRRKFQEVMLAIQIEHRFTKPQIFTLYANQIFLGHGVYGFEAGAQFYFSKHAKDLTLEEAALLAGLPKAPNYYSPINSPERALRRRNLVLNAMMEDGRITAEQAQRAKDTPIRLNLQSDSNSVAPYFVEEVRRYLEKKYGTADVHEGRLSVYTTLDIDLQRAATRAVLDGLAAYEHRHGWLGRLPNVIAAGGDLERYDNADWREPIEPGTYIHGLVTQVSASSATVRLGRITGSIDSAAIKWTGRKSPADILSVGDIVYARVLSLGFPTRAAGASVGADEGTRVQLALEQDSGVQGALLALDNAERRDSRHGRRTRLRGFQVQPRNPGFAADGLVLQTLRLHRRHRPGSIAG